MIYQPNIVLRWLLSMMLIGTLAACGLKGDLFLPDQSASNQTPAKPAEAADEADDEEVDNGL